MLEEGPDYQLVLPVNDDITEVLTYEKAIKGSAAKNVGGQAHPGNAPIYEVTMLRARVVALCLQHLRNCGGQNWVPVTQRKPLP